MTFEFFFETSSQKAIPWKLETKLTFAKELFDKLNISIEQI